MKIIKLAKAGEVLDQPHGPKPSGKLDSQIFLGKEDPSHRARKKKKKVKKSETCNVCTAKKKPTEEKEEFEYNPWAVCTDSVGREDKEKYESCVQQVKKKQKGK